MGVPLCTQVFNQSTATKSEDMQASWRDSIWRMYKSGSQHMRVAVYGCKHDPTAYEGLLKEITDMEKLVSVCVCVCVRRSSDPSGQPLP